MFTVKSWVALLFFVTSWSVIVYVPAGISGRKKPELTELPTAFAVTTRTLPKKSLYCPLVVSMEPKTFTNDPTTPVADPGQNRINLRPDLTHDRQNRRYQTEQGQRDEESCNGFSLQLSGSLVFISFLMLLEDLQWRGF